MNKSKLTVLFVIQKSKINKKGMCPIRCRITYLKQRKEFSLGLFVKPYLWDNKLQEYEIEETNTQLSLIRQNLTQAFLLLQVQKDIFTIDDIYLKFKGEETKDEKGVLDFYNDYLLKLKKLVGLEIKESTWNKFYYLENHIKDFIQLKYKRTDILLSQLDLKFLDDFDFYLKTEKNHKQVTINKVIQRFKKAVKVAVAERYISFDPFTLHKPKAVKRTLIYLTTEELVKLEEHVFVQKRLEQIRDCFIFCCYTGLAYLEMSNLKNEHIKIGFDGNLWIKMIRTKTSKPISVPLLPKAIEIIEKYKSSTTDFILPKLSNQSFNSYLKEVAILVEIDKNLTHHTARKTFATTVLLYNDVPMEIVSELLGHSNMTITQAYYGKILQKKVGEQMLTLKNKLSK